MVHTARPWKKRCVCVCVGGCLTGVELQFCKMEKFWWPTAMCISLTLLSLILKMAKKVSFMFCILYYTEKRYKENLKARRMLVPK